MQLIQPCGSFPPERLAGRLCQPAILITRGLVPTWSPGSPAMGMPWVGRTLELVTKGTSADLKLEENGGQSNVCTWPDGIPDKPNAFQTLPRNQNQRTAGPPTDLPICRSDPADAESSTNSYH